MPWPKKSGSFVYGLSALFYGECTVKDGRIEQTNFDTYNSLASSNVNPLNSWPRSDPTPRG
jgi:isoquinoline 1-oxidoreductase beta subunit